MEPVRAYSQIISFETLGNEATDLHNLLLNLGAETTLPWDDLRAAATRWKTFVEQKLEDLLLVTPATVLRSKALMNGASGLFSDESLSALSDRERSDFDEACRCLLTASSTASEFMTLRAAESLLRRWYEEKTKKTIEKQPWGHVLNLLSDTYPGKDRPTELTSLEYLKVRRDQVAHPDRISRQDDAEATLLTVRSLVPDLIPVLPMQGLLPIADIQSPTPEPAA